MFKSASARNHQCYLISMQHISSEIRQWGISGSRRDYMIARSPRIRSKILEFLQNIYRNIPRSSNKFPFRRNLEWSLVWRPFLGDNLCAHSSPSQLAPDSARADGVVRAVKNYPSLETLLEFTRCLTYKSHWTDCMQREYILSEKTWFKIQYLDI